MLSQTLHNSSNLWHIFCFLTQSFNTHTKINVINLVNWTHNAFLSTTYVWTMYLWKVLENQWVTRLCVKLFHHTMLSLALHATCFTEHSHDW